MRFSRNLKISIFFGIIIGFTVPLIGYNFMLLEQEGNQIYVWNPIDWNLKIRGNVKYEATIPYQALINGTYGTIANQTFHFLNSYGTYYLTNYTGVSVWRLLSDLNILNEGATGIWFKSVDLYETPGIPLSKVEEFPNLTIVAYKVNNINLTTRERGGTGPIRSIVNLSITEPTEEGNGMYWAKYLTTIMVY